MCRIRLFEESLIEPILSGEIRTPVHLCVGQEAVATGVSAALRPQDHVYGNHRSHGHYLAKGGDMNALMAEIYGKETGCCKGRGGSMHITAPEVGFMGATPIVAGTVALALGDALAAKISGDDRIVVSFFGDGAMCEGVVYEAINAAVLWDLPILFVCENNLYSTHMRIQDSLAQNPSHQISGIGINKDAIIGDDPEEIKEEVDFLRECLPAFLELKTYRLCGHVGPDDNILGDHKDIRPPEEVEEWKKKDPVETFEKHLVDMGIIEYEQPYRIRKSVQDEVNKAHDFAQQSPWPDPEDLLKYVYA